MVSKTSLETSLAKSPFERARIKALLELPRSLQQICSLNLREEEVVEESNLKALFPKTFGQPLLRFTHGQAKKYAQLKVGVVLSGGQASGGHNVICALYDALQELHPASQLFGFLPHLQ